MITPRHPVGQRGAPGLMSFVNEPLFLGLPGILFVWALIGVVMWSPAPPHRARLRHLRDGLRTSARRSWSAFRCGLIRVAALRPLRASSPGSPASSSSATPATASCRSATSMCCPRSSRWSSAACRSPGGTGTYFGAMLGAIALTLLTSVLTTLQLELWGRQLDLRRRARPPDAALWPRQAAAGLACGAPNIRQVAELAGVSTATVSRAR